MCTYSNKTPSDKDCATAHTTQNTVETVVIGYTHLKVGENLVPLLKCPFCNSLRNIHVDVIANHIRLTHPGKTYNVSDFYLKWVRSSPYGVYLSKEELKLPWIKCLWCNYRDKIEFDLSLHFLEEHRDKLLAIPITRRERSAAKALSPDWFTRFEDPMEYRLDKAVTMAKQNPRSTSSYISSSKRGAQ
ncbi:MAG: hypothetical protein WA421_04375 [Nitrososphaeraceae archaeon]